MWFVWFVCGLCVFSVCGLRVVCACLCGIGLTRSVREGGYVMWDVLTQAV